MSFWLISTPFVSALLGWSVSWLLIKKLFRPLLPRKGMGFLIQGSIPKHQPELADRIGKLLSQELLSSTQMEQKILDPLALQKITPDIEMHIDHFLRVKLKEAMPMVAMFVGDKTIVQLKEVFMTEMQVLFPEIMKSYINTLKEDLNIGEGIAHKLAAIPAVKIEAFVIRTFRKELRYVQLAGTLLGFIIGACQLIIILLLLS